MVQAEGDSDRSRSPSPSPRSSGSSSSSVVSKEAGSIPSSRSLSPSLGGGLESPASSSNNSSQFHTPRNGVEDVDNRGETIFLVDEKNTIPPVVLTGEGTSSKDGMDEEAHRAGKARTALNNDSASVESHAPQVKSETGVVTVESSSHDNKQRTESGNHYSHVSHDGVGSSEHSNLAHTGVGHGIVAPVDYSSLKTVTLHRDYTSTHLIQDQKISAHLAYQIPSKVQPVHKSSFDKARTSSHSTSADANTPLVVTAENCRGMFRRSRPELPNSMFIKRSNEDKVIKEEILDKYYSEATINHRPSTASLASTTAKPKPRPSTAHGYSKQGHSKRRSSLPEYEQPEEQVVTLGNRFMSSKKFNYFSTAPRFVESHKSFFDNYNHSDDIKSTKNKILKSTPVSTFKAKPVAGKTLPTMSEKQIEYMKMESEERDKFSKLLSQIQDVGGNHSNRLGWVTNGVIISEGTKLLGPGEYHKEDSPFSNNFALSRYRKTPGAKFGTSKRPDIVTAEKAPADVAIVHSRQSNSSTIPRPRTAPARKDLLPRGERLHFQSSAYTKVGTFHPTSMENKQPVEDYLLQHKINYGIINSETRNRDRERESQGMHNRKGVYSMPKAQRLPRPGHEQTIHNGVPISVNETDKLGPASYDPPHYRTLQRRDSGHSYVFKSASVKATI